MGELATSDAVEIICIYIYINSACIFTCSFSTWGFVCHRLCEGVTTLSRGAIETWRHTHQILPNLYELSGKISSIGQRLDKVVDRCGSSFLRYISV